jgi:hypothetical protein
LATLRGQNSTEPRPLGNKLRRDGRTYEQNQKNRLNGILWVLTLEGNTHSAASHALVRRTILIRITFTECF